MHNIIRVNDFGLIGFTIDGDCLVGLELFPEKSKNRARQETISSQYTESQLSEYFSGTRERFDIKIKFISGTDFQKAVWNELLRIPYGKTVTYGEIAAACGRPKAVRAVGTAIGKNPIAIIVPCHRVVAVNGPGGYASGLETKRTLLGIEGVKI